MWEGIWSARNSKYAYVISFRRSTIQLWWMWKSVSIDSTFIHFTSCFQSNSFFRYKLAYELGRHIRSVHRQERRYQCTECFKRFSAASHLRTHMASHSDETPFACNLCDAKFRAKTALKAHGLLHTGERPYACSECNYRATCHANMRRHMRAKHGKRLCEIFFGTIWMINLCLIAGMVALGHIRIDRSKRWRNRFAEKKILKDISTQGPPVLRFIYFGYGLYLDIFKSPRRINSIQSKNIFAISYFNKKIFLNSHTEFLIWTHAMNALQSQ